MGAHALSAGLRRGNIVAVSAADPVLHLSLVLALTKLGVVNLSLGAGSVPADLAIDAIVCDTPGQFGKTGRPRGNNAGL
ncbi:MAG: hypothetical protein WB689_35090 [Xanthobacteraceae bacterium]